MPSPSVLTPRELEVVVLVGDGLSDTAVAARLKVGTGTVRGHMASAKAKLGLHKRSELVRYALTTGVSHLAPPRDK